MTPDYTVARPKFSRPITPGNSLFLDAVRLCAALAVFFFHAPKPIDIEAALSPFRFEHDAVVVFFVLSGYVIAYAAQHRDVSIGNYVLSRAARMLSVTVPAIALSIVAAIVVTVFVPDSGWPHVDPESAAAWALGSLFFINQLWSLNLQLPTNSAYWSVAYEVWFYIIFGAAFFVPRPWRWLATIIACLIAGPNILLLLPIWLLGVGLFHLHQRWRPNIAHGVALVACGVALYLALKLSIGHEPGFDQDYVNGQWLTAQIWYTLGLNTAFSTLFTWDFAVGVTVACVMCGAAGLFGGLKATGGIASAIQTGAGFTFSVYLYQLPLMVLAGLLLSPAISALGWIAYPLFYILVLAAIVTLGLATETQKPRVQRWLLAIARSARTETTGALGVLRHQPDRGHDLSPDRAPVEVLDQVLAARDEP